jgi:uncharacterized repeat protein (TIGR01451 family)
MTAVNARRARRRTAVLAAALGAVALPGAALAGDFSYAGSDYSFPPSPVNFPSGGAGHLDGSIELVSVESLGANAVTGTSRWTYRVTSGTNPAFDRWTLSLCSADQPVFTSVVDESGPTGYTLAPGSLSLNEPYNAAEVKTVVLTMEGWRPIESPADPGSYANVFATSGEVMAEAMQGGQVGVNVSTVPTPGCPAPDLLLKKVNVDATNAPVNIGDAVIYRITLENVGMVPVDQRLAQVTDEKMPGIPFTFVDDEGTGGFADGDANENTMIDPGEVWTYEVDTPGPGTAPATLTATSCHYVENHARVDPLQPSKVIPGSNAEDIDERNSTNNESSVKTPVLCTADLSLTKTSDKASYAPGETVTYTVTVTNNGPASVPTAKIVVSDPMATLTPVAGNPAVLLAGQSAVYTGTKATTVADCAKTITNTATMSLADAPLGWTDPVATNDTASTSATVTGAACAPPATPTTAPPAAPASLVRVAGAANNRSRLSITKTGPRAAVAGQLVSYVIRVKNVSRTGARAVVVRDTVPAGLSLLQRPAKARLVGGSLQWAVGNLAPGTSKTIRIRFRIDRNASGRRCNTGTALARNAGTVTDRACTRIAAVAGAVQPAVTG